MHRTSAGHDAAAALHRLQRAEEMRDRLELRFTVNGVPKRLYTLLPSESAPSLLPLLSARRCCTEPQGHAACCVVVFAFQGRPFQNRDPTTVVVVAVDTPAAPLAFE